MMNDLIAFTLPLADYALLLTLQLVLILIMRKPMRKLFGAVHAYRIWLLPVIWAPLCFIDWSLPQAEVAQTWVADKLILAPMDVISPLQAPLPDDGPSSALPTGLDRSAGAAATVREVNWRGLLAGLWVAGLLTLLIRQCLAVRRFAGYLDKHAISVCDRDKQVIALDAAAGFHVPFYTLEGLGSPVLFGVLRPVLLLPADFLSVYDSDQRRLILSHEAVHLHRRDNLWNLCAWGLKAFFWFNPLVHLAYRRYRADQELSCDALALNESSAAQRRRYAKTLLASFGSNSGIYHKSPLLTAWSSLHTIQERIAVIKHYPPCKSRPLLLRASVLSIVLAGAGITALMTDTLSPQSYAAEALQLDSIPVDRSALSSPIAEAADRIPSLIGEGEFSAAESALDDFREMQESGDLNAQERFLYWRLAGDLARAREDAPAAIDAYTASLEIAELTPIQREDALLQMADAYIAAGGGARNYKRALALYQELVNMSGGRNGDYLYRVATTFDRLLQPDNTLAAVQEAIEAYGGDAPRSAYQLLWRRTSDLEAKRRIHQTMVELFENPQDAARLALYTRDDGSYDPRVLGPDSTGCCVIIRRDSSSTISEIRAIGPTPIGAAIVTPNDIRFGLSPEPQEFVKPEYPEEARLRGLEGWLMAVFDLDESGRVVNPVIMDTAGNDESFVDATLNAISQFRFDLSQHEPISEVVDMAYMFWYELPREE